MKRPALLSLALAAPLCFAASFYLQGLGVLPKMWGFMLGLGCIFFGIPTLSALLPFACSSSWGQRAFIFVGLLIFQFGVIFVVLPPGAQIEMAGIAHRLKKQPVQQVDNISQTLVRRFNEGVLATNPTPPHVYPPLIRCAAIVAESELPPELRGRFRCVGLNSNSSDIRVYFECEPQVGLICTKTALENDAFRHQIADGVYAYRYQRP